MNRNLFRSRRRAPWGRLLVATLTLGLAACGGSGDSTGSGASGPSGATGGAATTTASGTVRLATYSSFAMPDDVKAKLESETGLKIELVQSGDAGEMLSTALLSAGAPQADLLFGVDNTLMGRALASDAFVPSSPAGADRIPEAARLDTSGRLHAIDRGDVCVNIDAEWYRNQGVPAPNSLSDLTDPRYKDQLVVPDPTKSSAGLAFLLATVAHTNEGAGLADYWRSLRANGVAVVPDWDTAYMQRYTVSGGDRPLVVSYASSPPAEVVYSEGKVTTPRSKVMPLGCFTQIEFAGVLRGAANEAGARRLLEALLSDTWQEALPLANFVFPIVPDTRLPEVFTSFTAIPTQSFNLSPETIDRGREGWISTWRSVMG